MADNRIIEFEEEGVLFILPRALDEVHIHREDLESIKAESPKRDVIQVSLLEIGGTAEEKDLKGSDLTLIVYYTYDDAVRAKKANLDKPFLLIHDGRTWHEFKGRNVIYQSMSGSRKWVGSLMIKMSKWDDPLIAVGP
jgi:hypothetical protein